MKHEIIIRIGPDDQCNAPSIGYSIEEILQTTAQEEVDLGYQPVDDCFELDNCGWAGTGPRATTEYGWLKYTKRRLSLPRKGLRWDDAITKPLGWSDGHHCPNGIEIKWSLEN